jgi:hypothetical protein
MMRRVIGAMLIAGVALFGGVLCAHQSSRAGTPATEDAEEQKDDSTLADQVKEIKAQVKEINTLLHSGTIKVIVVLNPDSPESK